VAQPVRGHARMEEGEVAGVEDAVADAGDDHPGDEHRVARRQADERDAGHHHGEAREQHRARADAVDDEAGERLAERRQRVEERHGEAERRVRDAQIARDERKERRDDDLEEVARAVRERDEADDARVPARGHWLTSRFTPTPSSTLRRKPAAAARVPSGWSRKGLWPHFSSFTSSHGTGT